MILVILVPIRGKNDHPFEKSQQIKTAVDLKDPDIMMATYFAIWEHNKIAAKNKQLKPLTFVSLSKADKRLVRGMIVYDLVITAKDGGAAEPKNYNGVVWWYIFSNRMIFKSLVEAGK
ncbi:cystatin/monellin superfamily protein [Striga asiatica]|uniref:Cystatin/monellin superfamily protein n=1 Tax=Striga asiatica TaxID=4170 RepID=A0A5A7Q0V7_STRAF|nr:cystatin/monellin superfamily protein [Striga asiatica]